MGGRGTYAAGIDAAFTYKKIDVIEGVKVLTGIAEKHDLPMESHSSQMYIKVNPDKTFRELRVYGDDKRVYLEIAYHNEASLVPNGQAVLHYHTYEYGSQFNNGMFRSKAQFIKPEQILVFKKYFRGINI